MLIVLKAVYLKAVLLLFMLADYKVQTNVFVCVHKAAYIIYAVKWVIERESCMQTSFVEPHVMVVIIIGVHVHVFVLVDQIIVDKQWKFVDQI